MAAMMESLRPLMPKLPSQATLLRLWLCVTLLLVLMMGFGQLEELNLTCSELLLGQYHCMEPDINPVTQAAFNCVDGEVKVDCFPAPEIVCEGLTSNGSMGFQISIPCRNTNGYSYRTSLLLSIFLGFLGVDRMYLGYFALGMLKFCTMGLLFVGHFVDVMLIATRVVGPADGSAYEMDYYAPRLIKTGIDNETYYLPQDILT